MRAKSDWGSGLGWGQGPLGWGRLRCAAVAALGHAPASPETDTGAEPLDCEVEVATVDVELVDDVDDIEEDELLRCRLFRGMSTRLISSGFII